MKRPISNLISHSSRGIRLALATLVAGIAASGADAAEPTNRLEAIDVQTLPAQQVQLTFRLSGPAPEPLAFTIDNPARISVDLADTAVALAVAPVSTCAAADWIRCSPRRRVARTRVVLNLDHLEPYTTSVQGNNIIMVVGTGGPLPTAASGGGAPALSKIAQRAAAMPGVRAHSRDRLPPWRRRRRARHRQAIRPAHASGCAPGRRPGHRRFLGHGCGQGFGPALRRARFCDPRCRTSM